MPPISIHILLLGAVISHPPLLSNFKTHLLLKSLLQSKNMQVKLGNMEMFSLLGILMQALLIYQVAL